MEYDHNDVGPGKEFAAVLIVSCLLHWRIAATGGQRGAEAHVFYAVEMEGGSQAARALAEQHGLQFISRIGNLKDHFTLRTRAGTVANPALEKSLSVRTEVKWVQRQQALHRDTRAVIRRLNNTTQYNFDEVPDQQQGEQATEEAIPDSLHFNDPLWPMQWELFNYGRYSSRGVDLNVMPVWRKNITGNGVVVTIIDDGLDHTNPDLRKNYEAYASFDLRGAHGLSHDPMPHRDEENGHGTKCAGEVAMEANNSYCGVGIAFNARIGGIRLLDGLVTDSMEATSLAYNSDFIDIYTCSWGPKDDGAQMAGPGVLAEKALHFGAHKGRGGKGNVFVWASGNGGTFNDHCGADGYVNSIYTVAISAITSTGQPAYFGEPCPAVMAVTLTGTSTANTLPLVTVSNLDEGCVTHFGGTSSAAPIAAGVLALVLEANPDLTWRDVQHLIVNTAKIPDPDQPGWIINRAGYHVHDRYGFGLMDAGLLVQQAQSFQSVDQQRKCTQRTTLNPIRVIEPGGEVSVDIQSKGCIGENNEVNVLEHVQVTVSISSVCRGDLSIALLSPAATRSLLLGTRQNDASASGMLNWTLMTVQFWGEHPLGTWTLKVTDNKGMVTECERGGRGEEKEAAVAVLDIVLTLYGTYKAHRTPHEGPLKYLVSMGTLHPIPDDKVNPGGSSPTQELLRWAYDLESRRKVSADDIPAPRRQKDSKLVNHPTQSFKSQDMDDTSGIEFRSYLKTLWNIIRDRVKANWLLYKAMTNSQSPEAKKHSYKVQQVDEALKNVLKAARGVNFGPSLMHKLRGHASQNARSSSQNKAHLLHLVAMDIREMGRLKDLIQRNGGK
ncbi:neuroendocrine convertase 1-like [Chanos chanos]|uniref:Neuroendocrine convertase 1-like n=1 Tax=Chanos chanos TaxID=29144 RepID=A0A6J2WBC5_CHACN|nr:neuroendocrine convertase 1-like [Chanos chanos]